MVRKTLSYSNVAQAASLLMDAHPRGETTTLEVKTLLRHLNFDATQIAISSAMAGMACDEDLYTKTVTEEIDGKDVSFQLFAREEFAEEAEEESGLFQFRK